MKTNRVNAFTLVELLVVIAIIGVLVSLLFPAIKTAILKAEAAKAKTTILGIATACKAFKSEYGVWPSSSSPILVTTNLFANPRGIVFLDTSIKNIDSATGNILDSWKKPYRVAFDATYANSIANPFTSGTPNPISDGVIVWSCGPDGLSSDSLCSGGSTTNDADNVLSWQ